LVMVSCNCIYIFLNVNFIFNKFEITFVNRKKGIFLHSKIWCAFMV
jgi:hypothetical protein